MVLVYWWCWWWMRLEWCWNGVGMVENDQVQWSWVKIVLGWFWVVLDRKWSIFYWWCWDSLSTVRGHKIYRALINNNQAGFFGSWSIEVLERVLDNGEAKKARLYITPICGAKHHRYPQSPLVAGPMLAGVQASPSLLWVEDILRYSGSQSSGSCDP